MSKNNKKNNWWIVGLLLPPVGIVLYFLWRNTRKEDSKSVGMGTIISVVFWVIFGLSFLTGGEANEKVIAGPNYVKEVDVSNTGKEVKNWYNDVSSGDVVVTVIASSTCPHCQALKPIITASSKKLKYKLYFFEADQLDEEDYLVLFNSIELDGYEGYVPYTFVVKNREFMGSTIGEMTDDELNEFLTQADAL